MSPCEHPTKQFWPQQPKCSAIWKILITSTHFYYEQFVCEGHQVSFTSRMTPKHFDSSPWTETSTRQWDLDGTTAEETFTPGCRSLRFSPPPALSFRLTCQAEKNSFATRKGTICRSAPRITSRLESALVRNDCCRAIKWLPFKDQSSIYEQAIHYK